MYLTYYYSIKSNQFINDSNLFDSIKSDPIKFDQIQPNRIESDLIQFVESDQNSVNID